MTQTQTIDRGSYSVISVGPNGAKVHTPNGVQLIDWTTLREAARQEDASLAAVYAGLLRSAETMAMAGYLTVGVERAASGVGYRAVVRDCSGSDVTYAHRASDEGGDCQGPNGYEQASRDAADIRSRLGNR